LPGSLSINTMLPQPPANFAQWSAQNLPPIGKGK
jgi:hypothetical protein